MRALGLSRGYRAAPAQSAPLLWGRNIRPVPALQRPLASPSPQLMTALPWPLQQPAPGRPHHCTTGGPGFWPAPWLWRKQVLQLASVQELIPGGANWTMGRWELGYHFTLQSSLCCFRKGPGWPTACVPSATAFFLPFLHFPALLLGWGLHLKIRP